MRPENLLNPDWPPQRIDTLRILWAAGVSAGGIAKALGVSRGAVAGKAARLDLPERDRFAAIAKCAAERRAQGSKAGGLVEAIKSKRRGTRKGHDDRGATQRIKAQAQDTKPAFVPPVNASLAEYNAAIPAEQRVMIIDLTNDVCHWPLWGEDAKGGFYCGAPVDHRVYCATHARFAGAGYSRDRSYGFNRSANTFR